MAIYKNNNGTWYVMIRYQDWTGERKQKCKRGFATRKEAADWELQFKLQKKASLDMTMESFCALYEEDVRPSLKQSTWLTKENIIQKKILPYLGQRKVSEITAKDVMDWHNQMRKLKTKTGKLLSSTYLKTIHGQLSTIFNHAVKYYDLSTNPARKAGALGIEEGKEMLFWTKEEYKLFAEEMMDKPLSYYAFQLLYWCGIRSGEILGLKFQDFDFEKQTVRISRQLVGNLKLKEKEFTVTEYAVIERNPKTENSYRILRVPKVVMREVKRRQQLIELRKTDLGIEYKNFDYVCCQENGEPRSLTAMNQALTKICNRNGLLNITVHGLRHMFATILIELGVPLFKISGLLGHSSVHTTYEYYCEIMDEQDKIIAFVNNTFVPQQNGTEG